jgi:hypothetical protein
LDADRADGPSELPPVETVRLTLALVAAPRRFERLVRVAGDEPPRVRAILGALGEQLGKRRAALDTPGPPAEGRR